MRESRHCVSHLAEWLDWRFQEAQRTNRDTHTHIDDRLFELLYTKHCPFSMRILWQVFKVFASFTSYVCLFLAFERNYLPSNPGDDAKNWLKARDIGHSGKQKQQISRICHSVMKDKSKMFCGAFDLQLDRNMCQHQMETKIHLMGEAANNIRLACWFTDFLSVNSFITALW